MLFQIMMSVAKAIIVKYILYNHILNIPLIIFDKCCCIVCVNIMLYNHILWQDGVVAIAAANTIHISLRTWVRIPLGAKSHQSTQLWWVPGREETIKSCLCVCAPIAAMITEGPWGQVKEKRKKLMVHEWSVPMTRG